MIRLARLRESFWWRIHCWGQRLYFASDFDRPEEEYSQYQRAVVWMDSLGDRKRYKAQRDANRRERATC